MINRVNKNPSSVHSRYESRTLFRSSILTHPTCDNGDGILSRISNMLLNRKPSPMMDTSSAIMPPPFRVLNIEASQAIGFIYLVPVVMCITDLTGCVLGTNSVFQNFIHPTVNEGSDIVDIICSEDSESFTSAVNKINLKQTIEVSGEYMTRVKVGSTMQECLYSWTLCSCYAQGYVVMTGKPSNSNSTLKRNDKGGSYRSYEQILATETPTKSFESAKKIDNLGALLAQLETKSTFVRHVSHEIRTPLNVVVSGLDLLARMNAMLNDDSLELIDEIRSACKVAIEILNDLLTYEKLDSNILVLERSVYDLFDILRKVCDMFAIPARFSDINLSMSYDENLTCAMVDVDAAKISQVFRNLISNALKFTPFGGTVSVHVGLVGKVVRVQVRDSGVGMKLDEKQRLFGEIIQFNAKNLQGGGGSGMGLYLCGRIISIHEGAIGVDMEYDGPGTVFYCDLPLVSRDKPTSNLALTHAQSNESKEIVLDMPDVLRKPRVLVVDDGDLIRRFHCRLLKVNDVETVEAVDGQDAVEKLRVVMLKNEAFDGVLIDSSMPRMDGLTATRLFREQGYTGLMFGVTGNGYQRDIDEFLSAGVDDVLVKPLSMETYQNMCEQIRSKMTV